MGAGLTPAVLADHSGRLRVQVPAGKGNIRALRQLYKTTISAIEANFDLPVRQAYEQQLETGQLSVGWEGNDPV